MTLEDLFDEQAEAAAFARVYRPFFEAGFKEGVQSVTSRRADFSTFAREKLKAKSFVHASLAVGKTKKKLQKVFQDALDGGWGTEELGRNLRKTFDVMTRVRSLRIARTELTDVINDGSYQTLHDEGHPGKEWSTVIDGQERESHAEANGQVVGIDDTFAIGGSSARYPGDDNLPPEERINCRCLIVAAGLTKERKRIIGRRFLRTHGAIERRFVVHLRRAFRQQRDRILSRLAP